MEIPQKLELELHMIQLYQFWASTLKNIRQETVETPLYTDVHLSSIQNSQVLETTQMPYNWWMD
jgi:hypothetical protein